MDYSQSGEPVVLPSVEIVGTAITSDQDIAQSADTVDKKELAEQNLTLLIERVPAGSALAPAT